MAKKYHATFWHNGAVIAHGYGSTKTVALQRMGAQLARELFAGRESKFEGNVRITCDKVGS